MYKNIYRLRDLNAKLNKWEAYYQKSFIESRPLFVQIPTGTKCNLKCVFCTNREELDYKNLSFDEFLKISGPLSLASIIQLYGWGEPFVNPDYEKIFNYVTKSYPGIKIYTSTNGILLNKKWIRKLVSYGNCTINLSLNASSPKAHSRVMGGDNYSKIIDNIKSLKSAAEKANQKIEICLSFIIMKQNIQDLPRFIEIASDLNAIAFITDLKILDPSHNELSLASDPYNNDILSIIKLTKKKALENNVKICYSGIYSSVLNNNFNSCVLEPKRQSGSELHPMMGVCYEPWKRMMIRSDGKVTTCCNTPLEMGNIYKEKWLDIWWGMNYSYMRKMVNSASPPADCVNCPMKYGGGCIQQ